MKKFTSILTGILVLISWSFVSAQSQTNSSENRLTDKSGGYSFNAPKNWTKNNGDGGFTFVNSARTAIIVVKSHNYKDFNSLAADTDLEAEGFQQVGQARNLGGGIIHARAVKNTTAGLLILDALVLFSPYEGGALVLSFSDQAGVKINLQTAAEIASSIRFGKPQVSPAASQWQTFLRGKHLLYFYTSNGYSQRRDIWLCSSGVFYSSFEDSSLSNLGSGATKSNDRGTWRITSGDGLQLTLQSQNGDTRSYQLSTRQASNEIGLDGERYFVKSDSDCR